MRSLIGYKVPVQNNLFVLIIVSNQNDSGFDIYLNSWPQNLEEITKELDSLQDHPISFEDNIPPKIREIASKIELIKQGFDQDMSQISLDYSEYTEKQVQVIKTAMTNPVNEIWPYSKDAELAGLPKPQRFVGTTMKILRQPYICPVHRVKSIGYLKKKTGKRRFNKMPI